MLLPDLDAGCSLADSITADQLRAWKAENPGAVVVSYVNTTAEVKAESDYCCTSGNAKAVIEAIPADREILFLPDMYLGLWLEKVTGRSLRLWLGECHVHAGIRPADIERWQDDAPGRRAPRPPRVRLRQPVHGVRQRPHAHPLDRGDGAVRAELAEAAVPRRDRDRASSTGCARRRPGRRSRPSRRRPSASYMKLTTLEKLRDCLRDGKHVVTVPEDVADRARLAIDRMVAIG